ncbi:MAG: beta-lactamase family protein, partial [Oscillatoriales cyanobacterium RM1_1_9]|nr:beta-lactamase family protein [Oscillatoriales cyanobacterium RM1_1_9]
ESLNCLNQSHSQLITTAQLLTQTEGTTQCLLGIAVPTADQLIPLEQFIPTQMPPFIYPPGKIYSYSNIGIALVGYLVETLSNNPFSQYMEQNIFNPWDGFFPR